MYYAKLKKWIRQKGNQNYLVNRRTPKVNKFI